MPDLVQQLMGSVDDEEEKEDAAAEATPEEAALQAEVDKKMAELAEAQDVLTAAKTYARENAGSANALKQAEAKAAKARLEFEEKQDFLSQMTLEVTLSELDAANENVEKQVDNNEAVQAAKEKVDAIRGEIVDIHVKIYELKDNDAAIQLRKEEERRVQEGAQQEAARIRDAEQAEAELLAQQKEKEREAREQEEERKAREQEEEREAQEKQEREAQEAVEKVNEAAKDAEAAENATKTRLGFRNLHPYNQAKIVIMPIQSNETHFEYEYSRFLLNPLQDAATRSLTASGPEDKDGSPKFGTKSLLL
jgi:hypothetical protein